MWKNLKTFNISSVQLMANKNTNIKCHCIKYQMEIDILYNNSNVLLHERDNTKKKEHAE